MLCGAPEEVFHNKFVDMLIHCTFNSIPRPRSNTIINLSLELNLFVFVPWLKITRFRLETIQFEYLWANLNRAIICLCAINGFICCTYGIEPSFLIPQFIIICDTFLLVNFLNLCCNFFCNSHMTFVNNVTQRHLSPRKISWAHSCLLLDLPNNLLFHVN